MQAICGVGIGVDTTGSTRLEEFGVIVNEVINCGGISEKNPFALQVYADICNRPMKVSR